MEVPLKMTITTKEAKERSLGIMRGTQTVKEKQDTPKVSGPAKIRTAHIHLV
jgi:hypothetical protein